MNRLDAISERAAPNPRSWRKEEVASIASELAPSVDLPVRYFVFGLAALTLFASALPFFAGEVLGQHHYNHHTIAFTHLLVLGWIATVILGATIQLVPVALGVKIYNERLIRWTFGFHAIGVAGMVACFWFWNFRLMLWFGSCITLSFSLFVYNIGWTLKRVEKHDAVSIHIAASLAYLVLTFLAGQYLMHNKVISFSPFNVISAIHAHAHLAALGWFFMMIMGVSYRLIPMFALSSIQSERRIWTSFILFNAGVPGIFFGILLQACWLVGAVIIVSLALGLWAWEVLAILKARKRPHLDGTLKQALVAMAHIPALVALGLLLSWPSPLSAIKAQAQTGYGMIALLGFVSLFVMAMLYKIIPFLVWYKIYPPLIGRQPVPKLYELYSIPLQRWALALFLAGLWTTAIVASLSTGASSLLLTVSTGVMGCGILLFVVNMGMPLSRLILHACPLARLLTWWNHVRARRSAHSRASMP